MPTISLVVAYTRNRVIGRDNQMPWHLPGDLAHFKRTTLGRPILMGRKTWESIGRPLPGRQNIVITRNAAYEAVGATVVGSLDAALAAAADADEIFVIGGAEIFKDALGRASRLVATEIDADIDGDTWFPALPTNEWKEVERLPQPADNGLSYSFVTYARQG
jgi:dihydrofolate reductase